MKSKEIITYSKVENHKTTNSLAVSMMIDLELKEHEKSALILFGLSLLINIVTSNIELLRDGSKTDLMKNEIAEITKLEKKLSEIKKIKKDLRYYKGENADEHWKSIDLIEKDLKSFKLSHRKLTSKDYFIIRLFRGWLRVAKKAGLDDKNKTMFKKILVCIFEEYHISGANIEAVKKSVQKLSRENLL